MLGLIGFVKPSPEIQDGWDDQRSHFSLVRRANAADFMYSNFVSVLSRRLDCRVFYALLVFIIWYTLKMVYYSFFSFLFLHLLVVIIVTCSWGLLIPVIAVSVFLVAGLLFCICLIVVTWFITRGTEKHNLSRMRFKSLFCPFNVANFF